MRSIVLIGFIFSLSLFFVSCETDFDVITDYKEVAVVYGILNQNDSVHYFRISKAFLGKGNALEYAKIADSSSYGADINVVLRDSAQNGVVKDIVFDTVTLFNKQTGVFYAPGQLFYVGKCNLDKEHIYKLIITNKKTGNIVTSETNLIGDFYFTKPSSSSKSLSLKRSITTANKIEWANALNGRKYQMVIHFFYKELYGINDTLLKSVTWTFPAVNASKTNGTGSTQVSFLNEEFYKICETKIPYTDITQEQKVLKRYAAFCKMEMTVVDNNFATYLDVNGSSTGLTMEKLQFTNITNGYGLFASRNSIVRTIPLGAETIFDLATTTSLNFEKPN